jgi:rubrerythrin
MRQQRREFKKLEQRFAVLAKNEQWLADRYQNTMHSLEQDQSKGATLAEEEEHVLRCLGAALIMQWNTLPTKLRRELFDNAGSMGELLETPALRGQIARFLHAHKNDED